MPIHWTYIKGKIIIHMPDGTHSPKFDTDKEANDWLKAQKEKK